VAPLLGPDPEPVQFGRVGSSRSHTEVWARLSACDAAAVCVERRTPRLRHRAQGTLRPTGSPYRSQTSDRGGGQETGNQIARALAQPPVAQPASAGVGDVAAGVIRRHWLERDLELDSLRGPSWSTTARRRWWTFQSL